MEEDYTVQYFILPAWSTTPHDSQIFSMAVRSEASTGITGQMQTPD